MSGKRRLDRGPAIALSVVGLVAVLLVAASWLMPRSDSGSGPMIRDENNIRQIVSLTLAPSGIPMKDGSFDPYAFVRRGDITGPNLQLFRSSRSRSGPTDDEIARGDYTNFSWERYRGDGNLKGSMVLLLWDKKPDKHGRVLLGLSDGTACVCENSTFKLYRMISAIAGSSEIPMRDGAFDPYALVRDGKLSRSDVTLVDFDGTEAGPAEAEIARGDYTNFLWERYRGDGKLSGPPVPLLWNRQPLQGIWEVALSDGTIDFQHQRPR